MLERRHVQVDNNKKKIRQEMANKKESDISDGGSDELSYDEERGNRKESVTSKIIRETIENLSTGDEYQYYCHG